MRARRTLSILGLAALASLSLPARPARADLDAAQSALLADARRQLTSAEQTLRLAQGGVGANATVSQRKLALTRLESLKSPIATAEDRLAKLPENEPSVVAERARTTALLAAVATFEASLRAPPPPAPPPAAPGATPAAPPTPGAAAAAGVKLDYRQRESLKNAQYHVREVVGKADVVATITAEIAKAPDPTRYDHRRLADGVATLAGARVKAKNASGHLAVLPADGEGVAAVAADLRAALASLDASETTIAPLQARMLDLLDPTKRPELAAERRRLSDLASQISDERMFEHDRARAARLVPDLPAIRAEHDRIVAAYALWIDQRTDEGERLTGLSSRFLEEWTQLDAALEAARVSLPGAVDAAIEETTRLAAQAVAERKPAFFTGGIPFAVAQAVELVELLTAIAPEAGRAKQASLAALEASLATSQVALRGAIIAQNALPDDRYRGGDRADLVRLATDAWARTQPGARVVKSVIPSPDWKRETSWRRRSKGDWVLDDVSRLQVQLVVAHDDALVVIRPVNLVKDHTQGDAVAAHPMDGAKDELAPTRFLPAEKAR